MEKKISEINRRTFLAGFGISVITGKLANAAMPKFEAFFSDDPAGHGMFLFGEKAIYLSHLPMFGDVSENKENYDSPHRYQVILEVVFRNNEREVQNLYLEERRKNPLEKVYSINPEKFVLPQISLEENSVKTRRTFKADVFSGHFERQGNKLIPGLEKITVEIKNIIHFRRFSPKGYSPETLEYILFGKPEEMFLAHYISQPDNFDQLISVETNEAFSSDELRKGIRLNVPERKDIASNRLKEKQKIMAKSSVDPKSNSFEVRAVKEFYFEEGELLKQPNFNSTEEEKLSGF